MPRRVKPEQLPTLSTFEIMIAIAIPFLIGFLILEERIIGFQNSVIVLATTASSLFTLSLIKERKLRFSLPISIIFIIFLIWMFLSGSYSKNIGSSIWEILRMLSFFTLFLTTYNLAKKDVRLGNLIISSFMIIGTIILIKDFYNDALAGRLSRGQEFIGSFYWHNQEAGFLLFLIPIILTFFLKTKQPFIKFILLLLSVFSIQAIVFTHSRGGWLSLIAALILFSFLNFRIIKAHLKLLTVLLGILLFLTPVLVKPTTIVQRAESIQSELIPETRSVSGNLRTTVWQNSIRMIKDYSLIGIGPGAFGSAYYKYQSVPWLYARNAHNYFLEIASELGLPGLLLFVTIITIPFVYVVTNIRNIKDGKISILTIALITTLFGSLLHTFLDVDWSRLALYSIFWVFLAILIANLSKKERNLEIISLNNLVFLLPLILAATSLVLLFGERNYQATQMSLDNQDNITAEKYIQKAILFNPFEERNYLLLGQVDELQGKQQDAINAYQKAINLSPFDSESYYRIGVINLGNNNLEESQKWLGKAIETNPYSHSKLYVVMSDSFLAQRDFDSAEKYLRQDIEVAFPLNQSFRGFEYLYDYTGFKKDLAQAYLRLIALDTRQNKKEEANELLNVVETELDPTNPLIPFLKERIQKKPPLNRIKLFQGSENSNRKIGDEAI